MKERDCAVWVRTSTDEQHPENQIIALRRTADALGLKVTGEYVTEDSACVGSSADFDAARSALLAGVRQGKHSVILIRALDRLSRRGHGRHLQVSAHARRRWR